MVILTLLLLSCPPLEALKREALRVNDADPERLNEMAALLRRRHFVPEFSLRAWHLDGAYADPTTLAPTTLTSGWGVEGRVEFRLSQAVFDSSEINLQREKVRTARLRMEILRSLQEEYFEYISLKDSHAENDRRRVIELVSSIDDLTGGACKGKP